MENKYSNGKIYKIVDNTNGNIYIGSTIKTLDRRLWKHNSDYKRFLQNKTHYIYSFIILENNNYSIELIENYPCNNKEELEEKEKEYIENNICVNKNIPTQNIKITRKNYIEKNKEYIKNWKQHWYENNKYKYEKIIECVYCKSLVRTDYLKRHQNTLKCKKFQV